MVSVLNCMYSLHVKELHAVTGQRLARQSSSCCRRHCLGQTQGWWQPQSSPQQLLCQRGHLSKHCGDWFSHPLIRSRVHDPQEHNCVWGRLDKGPPQAILDNQYELCGLQGITLPSLLNNHCHNPFKCHNWLNFHHFYLAAHWSWAPQSCFIAAWQLFTDCMYNYEQRSKVYTFSYFNKITE